MEPFAEMMDLVEQSSEQKTMLSRTIEPAVKIYLAKPVELLKVMAVVMVPAGVLSLLVRLAIVGKDARIGTLGIQAAPGAEAKFFTGTIASSAVGWIATIVALAALLNLIVDIYSDGQTDTGLVWRRAPSVSSSPCDGPTRSDATVLSAVRSRFWRQRENDKATADASVKSPRHRNGPPLRDTPPDRNRSLGNRCGLDRHLPSSWGSITGC